MKKINQLRKMGGGNYNPYARQELNYDNRGAGTFIPGIHDNPRDNTQANPEGYPSKPERNEDPVVGFLYSISRKGIGEYWPLHLGPNSIGRADDCTIKLNEQTVSAHNSVINIKQMKTTGKMIASIQDTQTKISSFLNDEELDFAIHPCQNEDIITIGANYKLLLLLIDPEKYGLTVAPEFLDAESAEEADDSYAPSAYPQDTDSTGYDLYNSANRNTDNGTVDLSGVSTDQPGGTKFM